MINIIIIQKINLMNQELILTLFYLKEMKIKKIDSRLFQHEFNLRDFVTIVNYQKEEMDVHIKSMRIKKKAAILSNIYEKNI